MIYTVKRFSQNKEYSIVSNYLDKLKERIGKIK